ncbi:TetR/AcrR family transcriptional regulator [Kitasatospora sp. GP82]|uniref:TetR/AcrR family transcriptional regulator n=1 Tax=Kitasatospora sp. GP82 TaxID=3035089 RepID=UPI0024741254|nr:TetR/AcrR family transcriptional regulator [Kitasatospora sp. GP82]MDH6125023.1 AcrR family transcriptional regulator [Kitasatospora sp. GP82]
MAGENAAADPKRTIELLWDPEENQGRTGLSLDRIVRTAIEIADSEGLAALSMRHVAERLGFTTMSLYRHVPGKAELIELMRDAVIAELDFPEPKDDGWRSGLESWARAHWALHLRHLWLAHTAGSRRLPGPNIMADYNRALRIAEGTGLRASEVVAVVSLVGGFVNTAARQVEEVFREERDSGLSHEQWWRSREELIERMSPYSALGRLWLAGGFDHPEDPFDFGLARALDGIELLVRRRRDEQRDVSTEPASGGRCSVCGKPLDGTVRGRPRDYCSRACQQRAYRRRRSAGLSRET